MRNKVRYGVAIKQGLFTATRTEGKETEKIAPSRATMRDAVLDIPKQERHAYNRWV